MDTIKMRSFFKSEQGLGKSLAGNWFVKRWTDKCLWWMELGEGQLFLQLNQGLFLYFMSCRKLLLKQSGFFLYIAALCKSFVSADEVPLQFERNWCRERKMQVDWRVYTQVCPGYTRHWAQEYWANNLKTDSNLSYISGAEINPAGQFSHIYIQSVTVLNNTKTFGGDAWRMRVKGPSDLVASVYDFQNGTYEAVFLPMEPGYYSLQIVLDYTLCHALKNPPPDWFRKGKNASQNAIRL